jgi:TrmH family RNA methyltransferase
MTRITSKDNPRLVAAGSLKIRKYRDETGLFIISGKKLAEEARICRVNVKEIYVSDGFLNRDAAFVNKLQSAYASAAVYSIPDGLCRKLTDEDSPEGVFCVCEKPAASAGGFGGFVLICERLSDPGNVGTVLRSARAFGAGVILTKDCADPYSPKVLRAAMGAVFSNRVSFAPDAVTAASHLRGDGYRIYAAALHKEAEPLSSVDLSGRRAVIVGNEGAGLSDAAINACDGVILIEMEKECESLNAAVAASVIMYHAYKK